MQKETATNEVKKMTTVNKAFLVKQGQTKGNGFNKWLNTTSKTPSSKKVGFRRGNR